MLHTAQNVLSGTPSHKTFSTKTSLQAQSLRLSQSQCTVLTRTHQVQRAQRFRQIPNASAAAPAATKAEEEANQKRWKESGGGVGPMDQWRWSLNWDTITPEIVVGSCPRSASDIDRMVDEAGISAIICLQSDACFEAMQIDWPVIRQQAIRRGVTMTRVAVRDFDHNDQALMLPEAVRLLHLLVSSGKRVYVHCTAGINRATLTTVGYLTFLKGMTLEDALHKVKTARPQAHPYVDCWKRVRARLIQDREEEVKGVAKMIYSERQGNGHHHGQTDGFADWVEAENRVIRSTFERQTGCTLSLTNSMQDLHQQELDSSQAQQGQQAEAEVQRLTAQLARQQRQTQQAQWEMRVMSQKLQTMTDAPKPSGDMGTQLNTCRDDSAQLRVAMQHLASSSWSMLAGVDSPAGGLPAPPPKLQEEDLSAESTDRHAAMAAAALSEYLAQQKKCSEGSKQNV